MGWPMLERGRRVGGRQSSQGRLGMGEGVDRGSVGGLALGGSTQRREGGMDRVTLGGHEVGGAERARAVCRHVPRVVEVGGVACGAF